MKTTRPRMWGLLFVLGMSGVFLFAGSASAQSSDAAKTTDPAKLSQAKSLFLAGARAYTDGKYEIAVQAFEQANTILPGAPVIFSIGQAYRKLYVRTSRPEFLQASLKHYREYIQMAPNGDRHADAEQAIQELAILESRLPAGQGGASSFTAPKNRTLLSISSAAEGSAFVVDTAAPVAAGESVEVKPGKHHVRVTAPGFFDEERDIQAVDAQFTALDVALRERPARLGVEGTSSARVMIDGRDFGETPLAATDLPAGVHQVTITKNGRKAYSEELEFARGAERRIRVDLERSGQRTAAYVALGIGGTALVAGGVFSLLALHNEQKARDLRDDPQNALLLNGEETSQGRISSYNDYRSARDTMNTISYVAYGVGAAALGTGVVLYFFDNPSVAGGPPKKKEEKGPAPASSPDLRMMEKGISFVPVTSPTVLGGAFVGRF